MLRDSRARRFRHGCARRDGRLGPVAAGASSWDAHPVPSRTSIPGSCRCSGGTHSARSRRSAGSGRGRGQVHGRALGDQRGGFDLDQPLWSGGPDRRSRTAPWPPAPRREAPGAPHAQGSPGRRRAHPTRPPPPAPRAATRSPVPDCSTRQNAGSQIDHLVERLDVQPAGIAVGAGRTPSSSRSVSPRTQRRRPIHSPSSVAPKMIPHRISARTPVFSVRGRAAAGRPPPCSALPRSPNGRKKHRGSARRMVEGRLRYGVCPAKGIGPQATTHRQQHIRDDRCHDAGDPLPAAGRHGGQLGRVGPGPPARPRQTAQ